MDSAPWRRSSCWPGSAEERRALVGPGQRGMRLQRVLPPRGNEAPVVGPGPRPAHRVARAALGESQLALRLAWIHVAVDARELVHLIAVDRRAPSGDPADGLQAGGEGPERDRRTLPLRRRDP